MSLLALAVAMVLGFAPSADAHTDFAGSDPTDGAVIVEPVSEIVVRFTAESLIAGDGFVVLSPTGDVITPEVVVSDNQREFTLLFDPPLTNGQVGVQWSVRAGDAHPIEGAFSFTTTAPAPAPEIAVRPDSEQSAVPTAESEPDDSPLEPANDAASAVEVDTSSIEAIDPIVDPERSDIEETPSDVVSEDAAPAAAAVTMDDFLSSDDDDGMGLAGLVGFVGRAASQAGSLIAIGVVAFAFWVSSQPATETRLLVQLLRQASVVVVVGALVEAVGLAMSFGSIADTASSSAGLAVLLRSAGAVGLIAVTARAIAAKSVSATSAADERVLLGAGGSFSGAVTAPGNGPAVADQSVDRESSVPGLIGASAWLFAGLLGLSYVFDGHTVTKGNRLLTALVDLVHVGGGSVWLGGLVCLFMLSRTRQADGGAFIESVVKFSVIAAVALGAVGVAGLALTVTILDSFSELWTTAWGRLLMAKVAIVVIAVGAGAFNHWVVVPELRSQSAHGDARDSVVRTIGIELAALSVAVLLTAALVAAAS